MCEGLLTDKVFVLVLCFKAAVGKDVLGRKRTRAAALRGLDTPYKAAGLGRQDLSPGVRISAASTGWLHVIQQRANFDRAGLGPSPPLRLCTAVRFRRADDHPMVGGICESPPTLRAAWRHLRGSSMASRFHIYSSFTQSQSFPYLPPSRFSIRTASFQEISETDSKRCSRIYMLDQYVSV